MAPQVWRRTGWYLPGCDLAVLHVLAGDAVPGLRQQIRELAAAAAARAAFCVNLARVLTRELRLHRELDDGNPARARLGLIESSWEQARQLIRPRGERSRPTVIGRQ